MFAQEGNAAMCFEAGTVEDNGGGNSCSGGGVVVS